MNEMTNIVKVTNSTIALVSGVICAQNLNRIGIYIYNNSANSCYVTYSATSNSSNCTFIVPTFANYIHCWGSSYTGVISAIRNAGTGNIVVTELVRA